MVDQVTPPEDSRENWAVILDPDWEPRQEGEVPPPEAIVGGWLLDEHDKPGRFQPNPDYAPADPSLPTDPSDAVMRLMLEDDATIDQLIPTIQDAMLELAVTEDGYPLVGPAPDGSQCVAVITAAAHRERVGVENWAEVTIEEILDVLPTETDILLNPGAPASTRLLADPLRAKLAAQTP